MPLPHDIEKTRQLYHKALRELDRAVESRARGDLDDFSCVIAHLAAALCNLETCRFEVEAEEWKT